MTILFYYIIIVILISQKKGNSFGLFALSYLLVLFCFNSDIADREGYEDNLYYASFGSLLFSVEPLWNNLLVLFSSCHLNIQALYVFVGTFYLIVLFFVIKKISNNSYFPIACYMIGLFYLDVVQIRFTLSLSFVLCACYFIFCKNSKKTLFVSAIFIVLSMLVHLSSVLFFLLIIGKCLSKKKILLFTFVGFIVLLISHSFFVSYFGDVFDITSKVQRISEAEFKSDHSFITIAISDILILIMVYVAKRNLISKLLLSDKNRN